MCLTLTLTLTFILTFQYVLFSSTTPIYPTPIPTLIQAATLTLTLAAAALPALPLQLSYYSSTLVPNGYDDLSPSHPMSFSEIFL